MFRLTRHASTFLRWLIEATILVVLFTGVAAFYFKWSVVFVHPNVVFDDLRLILEDLFSLILLIEMRDLLRNLATTRLLDIIATVLARKLVLENSPSLIIIEISAIIIIITIRGLWMRFIQPETDDDVDPVPPPKP